MSQGETLSIRITLHNINFNHASVSKLIILLMMEMDYASSDTVNSYVLFKIHQICTQ